MERALQRADARGDAAIGVGACRTGHTHRERRVVTATMLGLHNEQQVKYAGVEFREVLVLQHEEEVLSNRGSLLRMTYVQRPSSYGVAIDVISIGDDRGELRNELYGLTHEVIARNVIGVLVEGVHLQHATCKDVHDVGAFEINQMHHRAVVEWHVLVEQFAESS